MLWELMRRDGGERIDALLAIGTSQSLLMSGSNAALQQWRDKLQRVATGKQSKKQPDPYQLDPTPPIADFLTWLLDHRTQVRRNYLDMLTCILPADLYVAWESWQQTFDRFVQEARWVISSDDSQSAENLLTQLPASPPPFDATAFFNLARQGFYKPGWIQTALPILTKLPQQQDSVLIRHIFLTSVSHYAYVPNFDALLAQWQARMLTPTILPYTVALLIEQQSRSYHTFGRQFDTLQNNHPPDRWPLLFDLITAAFGRVSPSDINTEFLANLLPFWQIVAAAGTDVAVRCFEEWESAERDYLSSKELYLAYLIARNQPFAPIAQRIDKLDVWDEKEAWLSFVQSVEQLGWHDLVYQLFMAGHAESLGKLISTRQLLGAMQLQPPLTAPPIPQRDPAWASDYPAEFGRILATLALLAPHAEAIARRILGKAFPQPAALQAEIAFLREKLTQPPDNPKLSKRIDNLEARLLQPVRISASRRAKLAAKLEHSLYVAVLKQWQAQTHEALRQFVERVLPSESPLPDHFYEPPFLHILAALTKLDPRFQALGMRLLLQPDTLLTESANQQCIATLHRMGLQLTQWLHPLPPRRMVGANGRVVYLGFTTDPIDIFMMGEHFQTCLSIGSFNFFSAIANGVDVNKQVLYGWDEQGRVIGRCLFALSDVGGLLTFHPYCHDDTVQFGALVGRFASDLATELNTVVIQSGNIPRLVAPDWYDDGALDLTGGFAYFKEKSPFRQ